jgi:hypothetical protein
MEMLNNAMLCAGATTDMVYGQFFLALVLHELLAQHSPKTFCAIKNIGPNLRNFREDMRNPVNAWLFFGIYPFAAFMLWFVAFPHPTF